MVKILYILDLLVAGGVEHQTTALIAGLDRTRFDPHVLVFYGERAQRVPHFLPRLEAANVPVNILDLTYDPYSKLRAFWGILRETWRLRPQIVHTVNYHGNILVGPGRFFMPLKTKLIISVQAENTRTQIIKQQLSWRLGSEIICISPHLVEELVNQAHLPERKIIHIPNGLDIKQFAAPVESDLRPPDVAHVLLMVTRITERKAPQLLVEALGLLKQRGMLSANIHALLVGDHEDDAVQHQIDMFVERYSLYDQFHQYPKTDQPTQFYHAADSTVLVALYGEGLPNVLLESLAAGRPVIVSQAANRANLIEHGKTGWIVRTGDVEHLAETIQHVLTLPDDDLEAMRENCRVAVAGYTMEKMVQHHQELYMRVLGL